MSRGSLGTAAGGVAGGRLHVRLIDSGHRASAWPRIEYGVWEFHMPYIQSPALGGVTAMDYNFWVKFNGGREQPDRGPNWAPRCWTPIATCTTSRSPPPAPR